jgi:serine/threonine protein kinase
MDDGDDEKPTMATTMTTTTTEGAEEGDGHESFATIESLPDPHDDDEDQPRRVQETDTWDITKKDLPLPSDIAVKVMDHADVVLHKRLSEASDYDLDMSRFDTSLARFQNWELKLGQRIGMGSFADIYAVEEYRDRKAVKNCTEEQIKQAEELKYTCSAKSLAIKVLRAHLLIDYRRYATGAADFVTEGILLAALDHPHILSLKGRSLLGVEGFVSGKRDAFFLVFERLDGTLVDRMPEWKQRFNKIRTTLRGRREQRHAFMVERIKIMAELADAMAHLHKRRIVHRDLKLSNVGIDEQGHAKLLDFGLAKILPRGSSDKETFKLTGNTGSIRYMAPEIGRGEEYNQKVDIFSFGILLYEVMNMEKAWNGLQPQEIRDRVHYKMQRPNISMFWPTRLRELLKATWSDVPNARLPMDHVHTILCTQVKDLAVDP